MTLRVLSTKLYPPPLRSDRVHRPQLNQQFQQSTARKLTLVSAPAGFGKTTAVSDWIQQQATPFIWYQIDKSDSDPTRFITHLLSGFRQHRANFGIGLESYFQGQMLPSMDPVFTELINEIADLPHPIILVLDDYHHLGSSYIDRGIKFLLDHPPEQLHLIIITREAPDLRLARLRGRGLLTEIGINQLRFTSTESSAFLEDTMRLSLDEPSIKRLEERTEGWVAGLQLASLSLVGRDNQSRFIEHFGGDDRYIVDYLMTEVLQQQSGAIQDFLLKTSILDVLSAPICNHLTGRTDSKSMLGMIDAANLFLVPLDNRRQTYRYHHLFADLLQQQLILRHGNDIIQQLHRQASDWYHQQENALSAITHALTIEDYPLVSDLLSHYRLMFLTSGEWFTLAQFLRQLPKEVLDSRHDLAVARAWEMLSTTQMSELIEYLDELMPRLQAPHLISEASIIKGYIMLWQDQPEAAIKHSQYTLKNLELSNDFLHSFALNNLGFAYRAANRFDEALEVFREVEQRFSDNHDIVHLRITVTARANIHTLRGNLSKAQQVYQNALNRYSGSHLSSRMLGLLYIGLGNIAYEWNDLNTAEGYFIKAFSGWSKSELAKEVMHGRMHLAFVYQAQGKPDLARKTLQSAWDIARVIVDDIFNLYINAYQARLDLLQERWTDVEAWADKLTLSIEDPIINDFTEYAYLTLVRWWLKDNRPKTLQQVQLILQPMIELADETGREALKAEALMLQARLAQTFGEEPLAIDYLIASLQAGKQFKRLYLNEGGGLRPLFQSIIDDKTLPTAVNQHAKILIALLPTLSSVATPTPLIEPLTERELDVLQELAIGHSNRQIAESLYVSIGTVKTHARHIYEKLSVNNRTQAVARARELGLLT